MNLSKLHLLFLLLITICYGCAISNIEKDYSLGSSTRTGILLFSFNHNNLASLFFRDLNGKNIEGAVNSIPTNLTLDWKNPDGRLIVLALQSGSYEIYGVSTYWDGKNESISIPFEMIGGKAIYIGGIDLSIIGPKTGKYTPFDIRVVDKSDRDITFFLQRYLNIKSDQIIKNISKVKFN